MICRLLVYENVDAEEEMAYQKFKEGWGLPKQSETTKRVL